MQNETKKNEMWEIIKKSRRLRSLNAAYMEPDTHGRDVRLYNGLVKGHGNLNSDLMLRTKTDENLKTLSLKSLYNHKNCNGQRQKS